MFDILKLMKIKINPQGNGACPICVFSGSCYLQDSIKNGLDSIKDLNEIKMELVIYACPRFKEKP